MENLLRRYARLVIAAQLKLVEGDSLSINTDSSTIQFARLLAKEATLSTRQTVMIVEINHG
ncbi:MAG: aminopeptidase, partial [Spirochaetia bacterium]|nr:aminopeptidase [Spirochaetia bacterium]